MPNDFGEGVRMYSAVEAITPTGFEDVWFQLEADETKEPFSSANEIVAQNAIVIWANPLEQAQIEAFYRLVMAVDELGQDAPVMFWVPHTVPPEARVDFPDWRLVMRNATRPALGMGLDGVIDGEPQGLRLALAVRTKIKESSDLASRLSDAVNERRTRLQQQQFFAERMNSMLWDYLRIRIAPSIPPCDYNLPPGRPEQVGNYALGEAVGQGSSRSVFRLKPLSSSALAGIEQVVKLVDKSRIKEIHDLANLKRTIEVMRLLSSLDWRHPNVVRLFEVYHSPSFLCFRMEYGGPENLYIRLQHRQRVGDKRRPLSLAKTASLIAQAVTVVAHLHRGPRVCHRDIKPENFLVYETDEGLKLKLAVFGNAVIQEVEGAVNRKPRGTLPFAAPEVLLESEYNPAPADVWSLGVVLLEVMCGVRFLERHLNLQVRAPPTMDKVPRKIKAAFEDDGAPCRLLQDHVLSGLQPLLPCLGLMLNGMLCVDVPRRWDAGRAAG
eukprot:CAMPEP_0171196720 /NCGR_PEP_ID=MMETSP0790-20130122/22047_1 /TAXON_ID=2925 /ORGANISM="Alexandrium catenella, Strain OF101" /LENGTH=495 /DNA_ID=CAMNT_0011661951 /DNA_START=33 /DNA_END=1516 /DNA_ORIENTATION=-